MSAVFLEKAFWGFLALVTALITVIYRLFNGSLNKDLDLRENKLEIRLEKKFEDKLVEEIKNFNEKYEHLEKQLLSLKNHENNNSKIQVKLLKQLLSKLDKNNPNIFEELDHE